MRPAIALCLALLPLPAAADCAADIDKAFAAMHAAVPYRSELIAKGASVVVRTVSEVDLPRALRVKTDGREPSELIMIGDQIWHDGGGGFEAFPAEVATKVAAQIRADMAKPLGAVENARCSETTMRDGRAHRVFEYEQAFKLGQADGRSIARLLVDATSNRPAHLEVTSTALGVVSLSLNSITYETQLSITAPPLPAAPAASGAAPPPATKP